MSGAKPTKRAHRADRSRPHGLAGDVETCGHRAFGAQARDARMLCLSNAKKVISVIGPYGREIRMDIGGKTHGT
jgi:hypothetical protein